jgi:hypothetical protein
MLFISRGWIRVKGWSAELRAFNVLSRTLKNVVLGERPFSWLFSLSINSTCRFQICTYNKANVPELLMQKMLMNILSHFLCFYVGKCVVPEFKTNAHTVKIRVIKIEMPLTVLSETCLTLIKVFRWFPANICRLVIWWIRSPQGDKQVYFICFLLGDSSASVV